MINIILGQKIRIYASVWDFCGTQQGILIHGVTVNSIPQLNPSRCLDISGIGVNFILVSTTSHSECINCTPQVSYVSMGSAYSGSNGLAFIDHIVNNQDLAAYQTAAKAGTALKIIACITNSKGQPVLQNECSDTITVYTALAPTHYISLSMGFVPPELVNYFQRYITDISQQIMTQIHYPPEPWIYVKTTYDRVKNAFNLWFYLPQVMSPDPLSDLISWMSTWGTFIIGVIMTIIAVALVLAGFLYIPLLLMFGAVIILSWSLFNAITGEKLAEDKAKNLGTQVGQGNKENQGKQTINQVWESSQKTQADCLVRLQGYTDLHKSIIQGDLDIYSKYTAFVTELNAELTTFTNNANSIITEFKGVQYSIDACNSYYIKIDSEVTSSNVRITGLLNKYLNPEEPISIACKGWSNQADCEKAECYWYNGGCHKEPNCWIPNPAGGCILSAGTGMVIVGIVALGSVLGVGYWLLTRYPEETRTIASGARGAVAGQTERAKRVYAQIVPPRPPQSPPVR